MGKSVNDTFDRGLTLLASPIFPLARIVQMLFLTGPFSSIEEVIAELTEPVDTGTAFYESPQAMLNPYLPILKEYEKLKQSNPSLPYRIFAATDNSPLDMLESIDLWVAHHIIKQELEEINTALCAPCHCTLCCTGPKTDSTHLFFEIPFADDEILLFDLPRFESEDLGRVTPHDEPSAEISGRPFYDYGPALFHWQKGWSLILSRGTTCPQLDNHGRCAIYKQRPDVCRRPQIFSYVLEPDELNEPTYTAAQKILIVWDCPYVREFKDEITRYVEMCGFEPVFKENKC